ncbi:hypothetical protein SAMN05444167_1258 [Terriglobus roseus]|uniref:Uncharacterized protein n=1 Tax=Terriglobus roseus TaxID=392734 RepID=A0A1G7HYH5_9BACT|nr:hypothetical protein SAMN05444167_1258 [Terriglobus roseus]
MNIRVTTQRGVHCYTNDSCGSTRQPKRFGENTSNPLPEIIQRVWSKESSLRDS